MPMEIVQAGASYEDVPKGVYTAKFDGLKEMETKFGPRLRWSFTVTEGPYMGRVISEFSGTGTPTVNNAKGKFLCALAGKPPAPGTSVDPDEYIGKKYLVACEAKEQGKSKIAMFTPLG